MKSSGEIMTIESTMTVREIAIAMPQATRVFEKLKIDYCCGGDQLLGAACATVGVEFEHVAQILEEAERQKLQANSSLDFQTASLTELIAYILDKHHVYTKQEMERLEALMAKVLSVHGQNHGELKRVGELYQQICADLKPHMFKEEQILFPYIIEMEESRAQNRPVPFAPFGTVNNPVRMMMMEHDTVGDLLRELREVSSNYTVPPDGCISYETLYRALEVFEADLHQHIHLENNLLFPRAISMERGL
jgi:regulator of cell morphogenesis and NO signaling